MAKNGIILKYGILSLVMCGSVWAQSSTNGDSKPVLPSGPLINHVPRPGSWSVTYGYPEEKSQQGQDASASASIAGNIRNVTTENAGNLTHVMITRVGGLVQNMWKSGGSEYGQTGLNAPWAIGLADPKAGGPAQNQFLDGTDFPGLEWLNASYFIGVIKYQNLDCLLFVISDKQGITVDDPTVLNDLMEHATNLAVIDMKSRYPLVVTHSGIKEVFEFRAAPSALSLPKDLADQIIQGKRVQYMLSMRAPRPY